MGVGIFYTTNFNIDNSGSLSWNLGSNIEVFDAELFAIEKAFKIAFERICKNYAWRTLQMHENHLIKLRILASFPPHLNGIELDWEQFQDWNEIENS